MTALKTLARPSRSNFASVVPGSSWWATSSRTDPRNGSTNTSLGPVSTRTLWPGDRRTTRSPVHSQPASSGVSDTRSPSVPEDSG